MLSLVAGATSVPPTCASTLLGPAGREVAAAELEAPTSPLAMSGNGGSLLAGVAEVASVAAEEAAQLDTAEELSPLLVAMAEGTGAPAATSVDCCCCC